MITTKEGRLFAQATGDPQEEVPAKSPAVFFLATVDVSIVFVHDGSGAITGLVLNQSGMYRARKVE